MIAGEQSAGVGAAPGGQVKADMAWRVTWRVDHAQRAAGQIGEVAVGEFAVRDGGQMDVAVPPFG